jgi:hypothetical protein
MKRTVAHIGSLFVFVLDVSPAEACPFCESETGQQVNAGIFNDHFWGSVLMTLMPFLILLVIVMLIYFDISWSLAQTSARPDAAAPATTPPTTGE